MTTMEHLLALGQVPILCVDGAFGMVIRWGDDEIGVQVPGEDNIRWIAAKRVTEMLNGALLEIEPYKL